MQRLRELLETLPFILQVGQNTKINKTRLIETLIMSAIAAGSGYGVVITKLENVDRRFDRIENSVIEIKQDQRAIYTSVTNRIDNFMDRKNER